MKIKNKKTSKILLILFILFIIVVYSNFVFALSREELRKSLKEELIDFFESPSKSTLDEKELKDLLIVYFESKGEKIPEEELDRLGRKSGRIIRNIYDKSKICADDVKICPDGSSVVRNPNNNCRFYPCPEDILVCGQVYEPVCGVDGKTYSNKCYASVANVDIDCEGVCPCECPAVCVEMWKLKEKGCFFNECGSGCGPDGITTFKTKEECKAKLGKCNTDKDCAGSICPDIVGGNKPKCDLKTNTCYCGGICGDGYCDSIEKRDKTCPQDCGAISEEAFFKFDYPLRPETFIFKLTDPEKIQEARDILSGRQTDATHVMGIIRKEPADYNQPWNYHLNPSTIEFFENSIEVCDAGIQYVEDHLNEVCGELLPNCRWCPWGSRLIEEVGSTQQDVKKCSDCGKGWNNICDKKECLSLGNCEFVKNWFSGKCEAITN